MRNIILLHGALGSSEDLAGLSELLQSYGYLTHTPDFPGHNRSQTTESFSIPGFERSLKDFMISKELTDPVIFGYSMGGYVALFHALKEPGFRGPVITLSTKLNWDLQQAQRESARLNPVKLQEKVPDFAMKLRQRHGENWHRLLENTGKLLVDLAERQYLKESSFPEINTIIYAGVGDRDHMVTIEETRSLAKHAPAASFYVLPDTGHPLEQVPLTLVAELIRTVCERTEDS